MQTKSLYSTHNAGRVADTPGRLDSKHLLIGILVISVVLRVLAALYMGNSVTTLPGIHDQVSYDTLARRVLDGMGFTFPDAWWPATRAGEPTAHWSFLYTLWLTAIYAVSGASPLVARIVQAILVGVLHPWLTWRIGNRLVGRRVGLVAAGLVAVYAYFVYYSAALMTESFYILGILWTLDLATAWRTNMEEQPERERTRFFWSPWIWLGIVLGMTVLLRQVFLLFVPILFLWLLWSGTQSVPGLRARIRAGRTTVAGLVVAGAIMMAFILPWTIRNYVAFDRFVLLNTNAGYAFFWGNHPIYGTDFVGILPAEGLSYQDLIPTELRDLDEAALDRALLTRGFNFVVEDPQRYALLSVSRTEEYFKFWPSADSGTVSNIARVFSFGVLLPFMLYGVMLSWRRQRHAPDANLLALYAFVLVYTVIHLLSWALIRYRLPIDAVLIVFAGLGIADVTQRVLPAKLIELGR